jgi:hypothetical protein
MNIYSITLFVHVISAIGNFFGNGTLLLCMAALRRAQRVEQVRTIIELMAITRLIFPLSILLLIATGLSMAVIAWGVQGWIGVALFSFVLIVVPLGGIVAQRRFGAIVTMAREAPNGPLPVALEAHIHDPVLGTALQTITALLLGIVFLMTNKPTLIGSILVMAIAVVLGLVSGLPLARARRASGRQGLS